MCCMEGIVNVVARRRSTKIHTSDDSVGEQETEHGWCFIFYFACEFELNMDTDTTGPKPQPMHMFIERQVRA